MRQASQYMKPQDVVILLKICTIDHEHWQQVPLAQSLKMSQSEISHSIARSKYSGLLDPLGKKVFRGLLMEFLQYGLPVVFPVRPGAIVRGIPTAHSAPPLNREILSNEAFVWPFANGDIRGHSITPLFPSVPKAALEDSNLHELLALTDAIRVGRKREKNLAIEELRKRIC